MKVKILMSMLLIFSLLSCKDDKKAAEADQTTVKTEVANPNAIQLTNLSDSNWAAGVGVKFDMFLTDYSKEKEALIKKGHALKFNDGSSIPYIGYDVVDKFIQIKVAQKASDFKDIAQFPNTIIIE